ncbi:MAG: chemotaxis protein CheC [Angelakisella sp.]|jgi:chemotaxis protein CheC|nr:chemotaxis protein CheC [Angelakisella sp.]
MALRNYDELSDMHIDALREIGNIGSGNAASSLAMLLADTIDISVPVVRILDYEQVMDELGGPEQMIVGLLLCLDGDVNGMIMFLLHQNFANTLLGALIGEADVGGTVDEMSYSALQEVANIMAASYVNAIADLTGFTINISVPSLCVDMLGAILSVPAIHYANISDKMIFIEDKFHGKELDAPNHILLIPDVESLDKIMSSLGIEL